MYIGISGATAESHSVRAMVLLLEEQGATVTLLMERNPALAPFHLTGLHALVLMGNDYDIDPADYGAALHPSTKRPSPDDPKDRNAYERSLYEKALVTEALKRKMPLLGVCGGMQRINVALGGTLHQHIPDTITHALHAQDPKLTPYHVPVQFVNIDSDSVLGMLSEPSAIAMPAHGAKEGLLIAENSIHHQAVDALGKGLKASARSVEQNAEHDIVEAFEVDPEGPLKDQCILGFQFHPEFRASDLGAAIAEALMANAELYAECQEQGQAFDARIAYERLRLKRLQPLSDPRTAIAKSDINLKVLHQLGVFRSMEGLRAIPVTQIQEALVSEHQKQTPNATRAPPDKTLGR